MRVLVTGITGFVGSHLAEFLLNRGGIEVHGTWRWRSRTENIEHLEGRLTLHECDFQDASSVRSVIEKVRPDRIFHLAGKSFVRESWAYPSETFSTNVSGQLNLFEAIRELRLDPLIQIAGSSEEYGRVFPDELPIREENPLRPLSPYAVSKVGQDFLGYQYFMSYRLKAVRTRGFNHTGPRRGHVFAESNFAMQIAKIEVGKQEPVIYVGNLEAQRDYTDVRDMVEAYWLALEKGEPGEVYNICSGKGWSIQQVLEMLLEMTSVKMKIVQDPSRLRPSDVPVLTGDCSKFSGQTGWQPRIPFENTLRDLLDHWRGKMGVSAERLGAML